MDNYIMESISRQAERCANIEHILNQVFNHGFGIIVKVGTTEFIFDMDDYEVSDYEGERKIIADMLHQLDSLNKAKLHRMVDDLYLNENKHAIKRGTKNEGDNHCEKS